MWQDVIFPLNFLKIEAKMHDILLKCHGMMMVIIQKGLNCSLFKIINTQISDCCLLPTCACYSANYCPITQPLNIIHNMQLTSRAINLAMVNIGMCGPCTGELIRSGAAYFLQYSDIFTTSIPTPDGKHKFQISF